MTLTAIDQLILDLTSNRMIQFKDPFLFQDIVTKAKEIEMKQIVEARSTAPLLLKPMKEDYKVEAEHYYNKKFKK